MTSSLAMTRPGLRVVAILGVFMSAHLAPVTAVHGQQRGDAFELRTSASTDPAGTFDFEPEGEALDLPLDDAIVRALQHNVSLVVQRYARSQSLLGIQEALGIYDYNLEGFIETRTNTRPPSSLLEDALIITSDRETWNFGLNRLLPWGGTADLSFDNGRTESSDDFIQPNPQFVVGLTASVNQPLLRNFGREVTERNIVVARNNAAQNLEGFRVEVENILRQVSDTYWDLVGAKAQLEVAEESLSLARELHGMNRIQVDVGTKAPLEMVQSEAGVARREEDIIRRRQTVQDAEDVLRRLLNFRVGPLWEIPINPVTDPQLEHRPINVEEAVQLAFDNRPEILQQRLRNDVLELDARIAKTDKKPQLDLIAGYGLNALAGTFTGDDPVTGIPLESTEYQDALSSISDRDFDGWSVGLQFSMPLQNRSAKARAAIAELAVEQGDYELEDLEGQVRLDVRRAARAVETAAKSIESAGVSSRLAQRNLDAERKRYENGLSTSFQVLEIQEDLSEARSSEVATIIGYRQALTAYLIATGQLLPDAQVLLVDEVATAVEGIEAAEDR